MPSDLIQGWIPVRVKKTRQNKNPDLRFRFYQNRNGSGSGAVADQANQPFRNQRARRALTGMQWIEALINVSALAGFVGIASCWPKGHCVDDRG
jgi:hypothetical protein